MTTLPLQYPGLAVRAALVALLLCATSIAKADGWEYGQRAAITSNYDSNPTLIEDDPPANRQEPESIFRFLAYYELELENQTRNRKFNIRPRVSRDYFPDRDKSELENTSYSVPGNFSVAGQTTSFNLGFSARREQILSSNVVAESNTVNTNQFRADDIVLNYSISPSLTWTPTPKDRFFLATGWSKQDFDLDFTGRSDFEGTNASLSYSRELTPRQSLGLTVQTNSGDLDGRNCITDFFGNAPDNEPCASRNAPNAPFPVVNATNKNTSDRTAYTVDYTFRWSPNLDFQISVGQQNTETTQKITDDAGNSLLFEATPEAIIPVDKVKSDSDSETYDLAVVKRTDRSEFRFATGRSTVLQNVNGTPQDRDTYNFNAETRLTQKLRGEMRLNYFKQESVFLSEADDDTAASRVDNSRDSFSGEVILRYQVSRKWNVFSAYRYRRTDQDPNPRADRDSSRNIISTSNQIRVGLIYTFKVLPR